MALVNDKQLEAFTSQLPARQAEFDILKVVPRLWPHIYILDVETGPRFRLALTGSHIDSHVHRNCTGQYLDSIVHGPRSDDVLQFFRKSVEERKPLKVRHVIAIDDRPHLTIFATAHPYFREDQTPSQIIGAIRFAVTQPKEMDGIRFEIQDLNSKFETAA